MTLLETIGLGLVQGLTEFLPVSSSGHLLAARLLLGLEDSGGATTDALLHLGTLGAVLAYYWKTWRSIFFENRELLAKLAAATVPAALVGFLFEEVVAEWFRNEQSLAGSLLFTALVLGWFDRLGEGNEERGAGGEKLEEVLSWKTAMTVGAAQVLALLPGVSRSGMTMAAGMGRGLARRQAVKFSFLLSAPIIAGASLNALLNLSETAASPAALGAGLAAAFISGLTAIHLLMKCIERISFKPFAVYLAVLAAVILLVS